MTFDEAYESLGVTDELLSNDEKQSLDDRGFVILKDVLSPDEIAEVSRQIDVITNNCEPNFKGNAFAKNLLDEGPIFETCILKPRMIAAAQHVLGPQVKFSGLNCNVEMNGARRQSLHLDWESRIEPGDWKAINSVWFIDAFTEENGATRLIPGTHWTGQFPPQCA